MRTKYYLDPMHSFTKLLKPLFAYLGVLRNSSVIYVADSLLAAETYDKRISNIDKIRSLLDDFGFLIYLYLH